MTWSSSRLGSRAGRGLRREPPRGAPDEGARRRRQHGERAVGRGYGVARDDRAGAPHGDTRFVLGSITGCSRGSSLRGRCTETSRSRHAIVEPPPGGARLEEAGGVVIVHVATHSSGLPRHASCVQADWGSRAALHRPRRGCDPPLPEPARGCRTLPGTRYAYSNLGVGVLGELLVGAADAKDYGALVEARLCEPLGLKATTAARPGASEDCAQGHDALLRPVDPWHFDAMAGAGCLRSTMNGRPALRAQPARPEHGARAGSGGRVPTGSGLRSNHGPRLAPDPARRALAQRPDPGLPLLPRARSPGKASSSPSSRTPADPSRTFSDRACAIPDGQEAGTASGGSASGQAESRTDRASARGVLPGPLAAARREP